MKSLVCSTYYEEEPYSTCVDLQGILVIVEHLITAKSSEPFDYPSPEAEILYLICTTAFIQPQWGNITVRIKK